MRKLKGSGMSKEDRGFASMDRAKQREIASKGGKAAHVKGTAHEWTSEEAREAGRKGGMASRDRSKEAAEERPEVPDGMPATRDDGHSDDTSHDPLSSGSGSV